MPQRGLWLFRCSARFICSNPASVHQSHDCLLAASHGNRSVYICDRGLSCALGCIAWHLSHRHLKALMFLYAFEKSVDCHLLSFFCDDSNLHISLFKYVLSTMGVSKESISKFLIGNRFHVKLRILSEDVRMRNFTWNRFPIKNLSHRVSVVSLPAADKQTRKGLGFGGDLPPRPKSANERCLRWWIDH